MGRLAGLYRRTGADVPYGDPRPSHGAEMEGWFWRFTDAERGRVVIALCGVNQSAGGDWATVAVAAHPGGRLRAAALPAASAATDRLDVRAGDPATGTFRAGERSVHAELEDTVLDVTLDEVVGWPRRFLHGGGLPSVVPFLNQYWHAHVLGGVVRGSLTIGGERWSLDGSTVYAERNWGKGFPPFWWWGQAQAFERDDVCVAFSGGHLALGRFGVSVSGLVIRVGDEVIRMAPPTALVSGGYDGERWRIRGRSLGYEVVIEGEPGGNEPHLLPVPMPAERRNVFTDVEHLGAGMHVTVRRRGGRVVFEGSSALAGLEHGDVGGARGARDIPGSSQAVGGPVRTEADG